MDKGCVRVAVLRPRRSDSGRSANRILRTHHRKVAMTMTTNAWFSKIYDFFVLSQSFTRSMNEGKKKNSKKDFIKNFND